jgi:ATP-dependent DNA helicase RecQ
LKDISNILKTNFNLTDFRIGQKEIISAILNKKDVLAVLPTGGGKSLCYQLPSVALNQLVVVISPLIALMKDQVDALNKKGLNAGARFHGQNIQQQKDIFKKINENGSYILYLSPERVQDEGFKNWIKTQKVALFAVDEAHCVSQWGHDFRAEYSELKILKELRPDVPVLALTASATPHVLNDIAKCLKLRSEERKVYGFYRPNLFFQVDKCEDDIEKFDIIVQALKQIPEGRKIIYAGTKKRAESLAQSLSESFEKVGYYHAGLEGKTRTQIQDKYASGELKILVATNAFGMGIDQPDVRLVIHYQMPANIDSLYQEMGRAGRDGKSANCLLLYSKKDKGLQSYFIENSVAPKEILNSRWRNLEAIIDYIHSGECRHSEILTYFKDT